MAKNVFLRYYEDIMRERLISPVIIKIAVAILLIKELWLLLGVPAFTDALISFLTVGAIPGTSRTLTPDEVYRLIVGVFVLSVLVIFRKDISRFVARRRQAHSVEEVEAAVGSDAAEPEPAIPQMPLEHPLAKLGVGIPGESKSKARAFGHSMQIWAGPKIVIARQWLSTAAIFSQKYLSVLVSYLKVKGSKAMWATYQASMQLANTLFEATVAGWRWLEPYIRRFDAWLDRKLHQYELTSTLLSIGREMLVTARKMGDDMRQSYRQAKENAAKSRQSD